MFFENAGILSSYVPILILFALTLVFKALNGFLRQPRIKGAIGERIVSQCLRRGMGKDAVVLDNVYLPLHNGTTTQIDHIVVCPQGVISVETKNYAGWIFGDEKSREWTQVLYRQKHKFQNPLRQNFLHARTLADMLRLEEGLVKGVVVFTGGCKFKTNRPSGVVFPAEVPEYIRSIGAPVLSSFNIHSIADGILAFSETVTKDQRAKHVTNLKRRHAADWRSI